MTITAQSVDYFSSAFEEALWCPVLAPVDSSTVVSVGDLMWLDTDDAKPASLQTDQGTLAVNQQLFHDNFIGVALDRSLSGQTDPIRIATRGRFEFDCASASFEIGTMLGPVENGGGTALVNSSAVAVAAADKAIARVASRVGTAATRVVGEILSSIIHSGIQTVL